MDIILLIVGLVMILFGANLLTDGASAMASRWGVSDLVIGLTVVAFGTSAPELVISVLSAVEGHTELSIGNVVGSNIFNILAIVGVTAMVRIGSCGALQQGIALGDLIFACGAIRDDGASKAYADVRYPAVPDTALLGHCIAAARDRGWPHHVGVVHSHESFYIDTNDEESAHWSRLGALGADMETAALFTIGRIRGVRTASILNNVVVYGEDTAESIGGYVDGADPAARGEEREIAVALEALYRLSKEDA